MVLKGSTILDDKCIILYLFTQDWDRDNESLDACIKRKDLGIERDDDLSGRWAEEIVYRIVDEKKWAYTRLRYGI